MKKILLLLLIVLFTISCSPIDSEGTNKNIVIDTITLKDFLIEKTLYDIISHKDVKKITPAIIPWATDMDDPYSESFILNNKRLKIIQPLKVPGNNDSIRRYFIDNQELTIKRIITDTLNFNFNSIIIDYGYTSDNVFQSKDFYIFINLPIGWNGLANQYRFVQLIDIDKLTCYELFLNYYSFDNTSN